MCPHTHNGQVPSVTLLECIAFTLPPFMLSFFVLWAVVIASLTSRLGSSLWSPLSFSRMASRARDAEQVWSPHTHLRCPCLAHLIKYLCSMTFGPLQNDHYDHLLSTVRGQTCAKCSQTHFIGATALQGVESSSSILSMRQPTQTWDGPALDLELSPPSGAPLHLSLHPAVILGRGYLFSFLASNNRLQA